MPVKVPDGETIAEYYKSFNGSFPASATPQSILVVGVAYVDNNCESFFGAVEQLKQGSAFTAKAITLGSAQAAVLFNIAEEASKRLARIAAVSTIASGLLEEYRNQYLFAPQSGAVRRIIMDAMDLQANDIRNNVPPDLSREAAIAVVQRYARNCTLANIMGQYTRVFELAKVGPETAAPPKPQAEPNGQPANGQESPSDVRQRGGRTIPGGLLGVRRYGVQ